MEPSIPDASQQLVDAQIERCADARTDADRLRAEVGELKALGHPRANFAAALFELDRARKGDPDARAAMLDVADSLLTFWKDNSGSELASSHPALEELWGDAVKLLSGFAQKRFQRQLDALWEARSDAAMLKQRVDELGANDDRRAEFARCLYHLELARQFVDGSRVEFARRAALLQEAYLDAAVADELVGGDEGLQHLWGELMPYLDEFFETLEERAAAAAAARAKAEAEEEAPPDTSDSGEAAAEPQLTAPPPTATPGDGRLPLPVATPFAGTDPEVGVATMPPGSRFPAPRDTSPPPHPAEAAGDLPMPPALEPKTAPRAAVVAEPIEPDQLPETAIPPPPPEPSAPDAWVGVSSLRSAPPPPLPKKSAPSKAEPFDINKTAPVMEVAAPLAETPITQPIVLPDGEIIDPVDQDDITATLPPDGQLPPRLPLPNDTLPPSSDARTLIGLPDGDTFDPDMLAEGPPPLPNDSSPRIPAPSSSDPSLDVVAEDEFEPGPVTQAFWKGTEVALGLLPPVDAPRLNTRVFAADHRNERKKLTNYLEDVKTRFTEAEVPESKAMQCLLKLYLAAHLKEKTLFGQKNEKRQASFREALMLLGHDPMAASRCAVWFEMDGPRTLEKLQAALEVLTDYLQFCSQNSLDPLAPTSPALFL